MEIVTQAQRPDLADAQWGLAAEWPRFMLEDPLADLYYSRLEAWEDHVLIAHDQSGVVARGFTVAFAMGGEERPGLPGDGWDGVVRWSWLDSIAGRRPTHVSALEILVRGDRRGRGVATAMVEAMIANVDRLGYRSLAAPVRPSNKDREPETPMSEYVRRVRSDGLPEDPWMRIHARLGATVEAVCPNSMTISGSLEQWRAWTGLPLASSGAAIVPGALAPVHVDVAQDHAVYVEPNVWMVHRW
jgi:GNAT superfamily N-acetyltransferase